MKTSQLINILAFFVCSGLVSSRTSLFNSPPSPAIEPAKNLHLSVEHGNWCGTNDFHGPKNPDEILKLTPIAGKGGPPKPETVKITPKSKFGESSDENKVEFFAEKRVPRISNPRYQHPPASLGDQHFEKVHNFFKVTEPKNALKPGIPSQTRTKSRPRSSDPGLNVPDERTFYRAIFEDQPQIGPSGQTKVANRRSRSSAVRYNPQQPIKVRRNDQNGIFTHRGRKPYPNTAKLYEEFDYESFVRVPNAVSWRLTKDLNPFRTPKNNQRRGLYPNTGPCLRPAGDLDRRTCEEGIEAFPRFNHAAQYDPL